MKIFWDTNLFIYLWEDSPWQKTTQEFSRFIIANNHTVVTSSLTVGEILVRPIRMGSEDSRKTYLEAFRSLHVGAFDLDAAAVFAELRAAHPALRPPDAIQLACASISDCDLFVTNDDRLAAFRPSRIGGIGSLRDWPALV